MALTVTRASVLLLLALADLAASNTTTRATEIGIMPLETLVSADDLLAAAGPPLANDSRSMLRDYDDAVNPRSDTVRTHYRLMREGQTLDFVRRMLQKYSFDDGQFRAKMTVRQAFSALDGYVDSSDPDMALPNIIHNFQTAEGIRAAGHADWMQLVGLIHDMGKLMFLWGDAADGQRGTADGPQWALGGDTWIAGVPLPASAVFPEFNALNADERDPRYNASALGVYYAGIGLDNVLFAYGHDEYLYRMLVGNAVAIPPAGLRMIRYHSCYPWHSGGAYRELMAPEDHATLAHVLEFNRFDLYTKDENSGRAIDLDALWPYYQALIDKYMPGELRW